MNNFRRRVEGGTVTSTTYTLYSGSKKSTWFESENFSGDPITITIYPYLDVTFLKTEYYSDGSTKESYIKKDYSYSFGYNYNFKTYVTVSQEGSIPHLSSINSVRSYGNSGEPTNTPITMSFNGDGIFKLQTSSSYITSFNVYLTLDDKTVLLNTMYIRALLENDGSWTIIYLI